MKDLVKLQLFRYLSNEISKDTLYKWALDLLHKILGGNILKINYLEVWAIITGLVEINDIDDSYCDEMIHRFFRILSGDENNTFVFAMKIPEKYVINNLSNTMKILKKYSLDRHLSSNEVNTLKLIMGKKINIINTLNELLEVQIISLLNWGYEFENDNNIIEFEPKSTVFIDEDVSMEKNFLSKIFTLLDCYEGKKCFFVQIIFNNGVTNISVQV